MVSITDKLTNIHLDYLEKGAIPYDAYGCWNSLIALDSDGNLLGIVPAHDGDFYPETPEDYVQAIKQHLNQTIAQPFPVRVDIDITQDCSSDCTFCFSRKYREEFKYKGAWIKARDLEAIFKQCAEWGTSTIRYCGGGDPLAHPEIKNLLALPKKYGFKLTLITNGDLLNEELSNLIISNVDHLRWSVNAVVNETRELIHRPSRNANSLDQTIYWIKYIGEKSSTLPSKDRIMIWATYLLLPENVHEIRQAVPLLREAKVNSVSFRPVFHGLHHAWTIREKQKLAFALCCAQDSSMPPKFNVFTPSREVKKTNELVPSKYFSTCYSRFLRTVIEACSEGQLLQSCGMYRGKYSTGQLMLRGNPEIGKAWRTYNKYPVPLNAPENCKRCIDVSINNTLAFIYRMLNQIPDTQFYRARNNSTNKNWSREHLKSISSPSF